MIIGHAWIGGVISSLLMITNVKKEMEFSCVVKHENQTDQSHLAYVDTFGKLINIRRILSVN